MVDILVKRWEKKVAMEFLVNPTSPERSRARGYSWFIVQWEEEKQERGVRC